MQLGFISDAYWMMQSVQPLLGYLGRWPLSAGFELWVLSGSHRTGNIPVGTSDMPSPTWHSRQCLRDSTQMTVSKVTLQGLLTDSLCRVRPQLRSVVSLQHKPPASPSASA
jgi:hypothetical protein